MPKFLAGKVVVITYETWASSEEEARDFIQTWQEGESEELEAGIKVTKYKMGWEEFNNADPTSDRDKVLAGFLQVMQNKIPGMPKIIERTESSKIIRPYDPYPEVDIHEGEKKGKL